ncbi:SDR family NAD(P)-dependent oxidoreductase [Novosphingobium mangrovi (ex Hu et al. 2023)]|uniref:SDR family oxidoreductase n=1 Tax=Novosphingobium mangrovi (ex Hu et al. 2023) TaxID=2930094 RepID=A0ABT0AEQ0_9SPHN|nr:SDR family oxidoreductase [Novosphingobium mangrovi (ex Hu et al. 2023)]MCJ1961655.1 SDR family oxidoreductase [Novosphingobium mangrovi (ex Hu et al. 2023)]
MARMEGKTVLVTGAAGGLGFAIARTFADEGAHAVLVDRDAQRLAQSVEELRAAGASCSSLVADLSEEDSIRALADEVCTAHASLDVLVNNAGLAYGEIASGFFGLGFAKWQHYLAVNTLAPLLLAEHLRAPLARARGLIINQSSMASNVPGTAYGVTKAALNAVTFGLASQLAGEGVRCVAIAPGMMETEASTGALGDEAMARLTGMQLAPSRPGSPSDIAEACLYLASREGSFLNNLVLPVDAGNRLRGYRG